MIEEQLNAELLHLSVKKTALEEAERQCKELKKEVRTLEEETLPNLLDEAGVYSVTLKSGFTVSFKETLFTKMKGGKIREKSTTDNKEAVSELEEKGVNANDFFKPVFVVHDVPQDIQDHLIAALEEYGAHYEMKYQYSPASVSAVARELYEDGVGLSEDNFSQHLKRGVKITQH